MRLSDYERAKQHVYGLAHEVCLNGKEQKVLLDCLHEIEKEAIRNGATGKEIIRNLLFPIMDGLMYGNWPFNKK